MLSHSRLVSALALSLPLAACSSGSSGSGAPTREQVTEIKIAAAADLSRAFPDVAKAFEAKTGKKVAFSFGASGMLAKQVSEGAPFDLFAAANASYVDDAVKSGRCDGTTKMLYARGHLVVWTKKGSAKLVSLADLADPRFVKIAIANPEHAPYGKAAREALQKAGIWDKVQPKLVFGENVQQALQFAQTGNADAAIVGLSLALATDGERLEIPESEHAPLDQALVVCGSGARAAVAKDFAAFLASPEGRTILTTYGFVTPGETVH
ncbi:MAG: molybdate ABC transporter substrate-binding protein [Polyangiaceae bacterium]